MSLPAVTGSQGGAGLVGKTFHSLELEEPGSQTTGPPDRIRRLTDRVGSVLPVHPDGSSLVPSQKEDAHQLPKAPGSNPGSKDLSIRPGRQKGAAVTGQSDNTSLHKQPRLDSVPPGNQVIQGLRMWCLERDIFLTAQHLLGVENIRANRESRVMKDRSDWMPNPEIFHQIYFSQLEVNLFATCPSFQLPLFSWPLAEVTDAFLQDKSCEGLCQFPLEPDREGCGKSRATEGRANPSGANMALSALVPQPFCGRPPEDRSSRQSNSEDLDLVPLLAVWPIRQHHTSRKLSNKATDLVLSSWCQ